MTEYTAVAIRAKTQDVGCSRIETTDPGSPSSAIPTDGLPVEEALHEDALVRELEQRGHAMPVGRTLDDLGAGLLARVHALSERGVVHLFAEGGGIVLATAGSTAGDRRRAVEGVPEVPERHLASKHVFGVLFDAGEPSSHYSEDHGWGLTAKVGKTSPDAELEAAAGRFRASRSGSLAVADTKAERRRIGANRKRLRAEFVARRRREEDLVVRPAREIDAARNEARMVHWTDEEGLGRRAERASRSGRTAYDTARAVYLHRLPTLAHRLLHLLRREGGAVGEREFVSRHAKLAGTGATDPEAALRAALRELAEAGKVRRLRSRATSEVFLAATEPLDERGFRRSLNGLIRDPRFGIANPWTGTDGVEPEGEEIEEALLSSDTEDVFSEETARQALLDNAADEGAREEIEALTA